MSSTFALSVVNLFVGMCRGGPGVPLRLRALGYRDHWLDGGLPGDDTSRLYALLALASESMRHTLFVEIATGPRIDPARIESYARTTAVDVRSATSLSRNQTETWGVAVVGRAKHRDTLLECVAELGIRPALLLCDRAGVTLEANPFVQTALTEVFRPSLAVDWSAVPRCWVSFAHDSPSIVVAEAVLAEVIGRFLRGEARIEISKLARGHALWQLATSRGRRRLESRIGDVLADAAAREMRPWFRVSGRMVEAVGGTDAGQEMPLNPRSMWRLTRSQRRLFQRLGKEREEAGDSLAG